jgi:hypothetical protein
LPEQWYGIQQDMFLQSSPADWHILSELKDIRRISKRQILIQGKTSFLGMIVP